MNIQSAVSSKSNDVVTLSSGDSLTGSSGDIVVSVGSTQDSMAGRVLISSDDSAVGIGGSSTVTSGR